MAATIDTTAGERELVGSRVRFVIGVDEAGRGCMAGPVGVAAALYRISDTAVHYTVKDSKMMPEAAREETFSAMCAELGQGDNSSGEACRTELMATGACTSARYQRMKPLQGFAVRLVEVGVINERNILNATLEGMAAVCNALVQAYNATAPHLINSQNCAVLVDGNRTPWTFLSEEERAAVTLKAGTKKEYRKRIGVVYDALDGFSCTTVVKGDSRFLSIGAASILAKVSRDSYAVRVMHQAEPRYGFDRHKGYCTEEHTRLLRLHGPCVFHRLDYAPVRDALER